MAEECIYFLFDIEDTNTTLAIFFVWLLEKIDRKLN